MDGSLHALERLEAFGECYSVGGECLLPALALTQLPSWIPAVLSVEGQGDEASFASLLEKQQALGGPDAFVTLIQAEASPLGDGATATLITDSLREIDVFVSSGNAAAHYSGIPGALVTVEVPGSNLFFIRGVFLESGGEIDYDISDDGGRLMCKVPASVIQRSSVADGAAMATVDLTIELFFHPSIAITIPCAMGVDVAWPQMATGRQFHSQTPGDLLQAAVAAARRFTDISDTSSDAAVTNLALSLYDEVMGNVSHMLTLIPAEWMLFAEAGALMCQEEDPGCQEAAKAFKDLVCHWTCRFGLKSARLPLLSSDLLILVGNSS